jgi:hypothetical protein
MHSRLITLRWEFPCCLLVPLKDVLNKYGIVTTHCAQAESWVVLYESFDPKNCKGIR